MSYDKQQQLNEWDSSRTTGDDSDYDWDSAGNLKAYDEETSSNPYPDEEYDADVLNQIQPTTGSAFGYDDDGNLTGDGVWTYQYDTRNRIKYMYSSSLTKSLRFKYDYMGRRVEKRVYNNTSGTGTGVLWKRFVYDGWKLVAEIDVSNPYGEEDIMTLSKTFFWGLDKSDSIGGAGGAMGLLMFRDHVPGTEVDYFPVYDLNGNATGIMDDSGDLVAWYEYDPFGKIIEEDGTGGAETLNSFGFSTQYTDRETGLVYYGLRYYDPSKARFINRDPIGEDGGLNLYRFVGNNPASRIDVLGLSTTVLAVRSDSVPKGQTLYRGRYYSYSHHNGSGNPVFNLIPLGSGNGSWSSSIDPESFSSGGRSYTESSEAGGDELGFGGSDYSHWNAKIKNLIHQDGDRQKHRAMVKTRSSDWTKEDLMAAVGSSLVYDTRDGGLLNHFGIGYHPNDVITMIHGFGAALYQAGNGKYMLAFRGTRPTSMADWVANIDQWANLPALQYEYAIDLATEVVQKFGVGNVIMVGHSLGGGLASAAANATGARGITFNAAGLSSRYDTDDHGGIRAHYILGDILTNLQGRNAAAGTRIMHRADSVWDTGFARHSINQFLQ